MEADREFWSFSDKLRLETANLAGLSLGESIWSDPLLSTATRRLEDRRNVESSAAAVAGPSDLWKTGFGGGSQKLAFANHHLGRYNYKNSPTNANTNNYDNHNYNTTANNNGANKGGSYFNGGYSKGEVKNHFNKAVGGKVNYGPGGSGGRKNNSNDGGKKKGNSNNNNNNTNSGNGGVDKRFKTLPPSESLPRSEAVGGYIFVCNNDTMEENLRRQLFGLPPRYRDSVRAITPGLPLFLYNYSTHQLHGIFEASSFGGTNIDPTAWGDKKCPGESRFPAQVRVAARKIYEPLEEDSFRPVLHHYDGPKFRLELSVPEAVELLDIFEGNNA